MSIIRKQRHNTPPEASFEVKSCTGKKRYGSEADALSMLEIQRQYGQDTSGIRPYRCGFCGKWHLGHKQ